MTESRFSFLQEEFPNLYEKCVQAEQAVEWDVAMLRIRQTLEYIVRDLGAQSQDLFQSINELEGRNIINLKISQRFHDVRRMANQAVHGNTAPETKDVRYCMDNLLLLMVWYGVEKGKTYTLEQFSPADVASVRGYLANAGKLPKEAAVYEVNTSQSIDPLQLAGSFQFSEDDLTEQNELERDVFETEKEYEQRIAAMEPVHIGYGILDTRRKDGYTDVNFLVHHVDHNPDVQFSPISAFYTTGMTEEQVIDSELVAKLKVYENKICCDYSQVYLQHDGDLTPVHPIYWDTFFYENETEFNERISTMPLLPFGMAMAVRREYDLTTEELPFVINPFQYAEKVLKNFLPENKRMTIQCHRGIAKNVCNEKKPCLLFLKLHTLEAVAQSLLWRKDIGKIVEIDYPKDVDWYQAAAKRGNIQAQANLEKIEKAEEFIKLTLEANKGDTEAQVKLEKIESMEELKLAANSGMTWAQNNLGNCYYYGEGVEQDYQKAVEWYRKAAEQGNAEAQNNLGECYYTGKGVEKDYLKAVTWFQKGAEQENTEAQENLRKFYYRGEQDNWNSVKNHQKAIAQGGSPVPRHVANRHQGNAPAEKRKETVDEFEKLKLKANNGDAQAQNSLGDCYYNGRGVCKDYRQALEWYRKAAEQGNASAQNSLGDCYYNGKGVYKDYRKAIEWYRKAADQGHAQAQHNLETCGHAGEYHNTFGRYSTKGDQKESRQENKQSKVSPDVEGLKLLANQGRVEAQYRLGYCYYTGKGVDKDFPEAVKWFRIAAEQGYADAQSSLGTRYYTGEGVDQDYGKAVEWYRKAAEQGHAWAQNNLGRCYYNGQGVEEDYQQAMNWYRKAAEQGHVQARHNLESCCRSGSANVQYYRKNIKEEQKSTNLEDVSLQNQLGDCYFEGSGVEKNYRKAVACYRKAAEMGYASAQYNLGRCYSNGQGVKQDYQQTMNWYRKAANQGHAVAQNSLGNCYYNGMGVEKNYRKAVEWYRKAADRGLDKAQNNLGNCYLDGRGVEKDCRKAAEYYRKAADQGYASAQYNLGGCYYYGVGVEKDYREAVKWYRKGAEQGNFRAQNQLGFCYYNGHGVYKDYPKAVEWYRKAADQGHAVAQNHLGQCYIVGEGVEKDYREAVDLFQEAADKGLAQAQTSLGICYYNGYGVETDYKKAVEWYRQASAQGFSWAQYNLGYCYYNGDGIEKDLEKAIEWFQKAACQDKDDEKLQNAVRDRLAEIQKLKMTQDTPKTNKSGCFITTAVCDSLHKGDDCYELTAFRRFRDDWLARQADGPALIEEYYDVAPKIVETINTKDNRNEIYQEILNDYLKPCLTLIERQELEACKSLYMEMVKKLQHRYLS